MGFGELPLYNRYHIRVDTFHSGGLGTRVFSKCDHGVNQLQASSLFTIGLEVALNLISSNFN